MGARARGLAALVDERRAEGALEGGEAVDLCGRGEAEAEAAHREQHLGAAGRVGVVVVAEGRLHLHAAQPADLVACGAERVQVHALDVALEEVDLAPRRQPSEHGAQGHARHAPPLARDAATWPALGLAAALAGCAEVEQRAAAVDVAHLQVHDPFGRAHRERQDDAPAVVVAEGGAHDRLGARGQVGGVLVEQRLERDDEVVLEARLLEQRIPYRVDGVGAELDDDALAVRLGHERQLDQLYL